MARGKVIYKDGDFLFGKAFLVLPPGFGYVDVHTQAVGLGKIGGPLPQLRPGGVLGVDGGVKENLTVIVPMP